jgi:hypothetical protein
MNATELTAEIATSKALLAAMNAAITALADPTVKSYDIDTGQGQQKVTRHDLPMIMNQRRALMNEICTMEARLKGNGVVMGVPGW